MVNDTQNDFQLERHNNQSREAGKNDLQVLVPLIIKNWYWFVITLAVAFLGVRFYIGHTMPVYRTSATVLINETEERAFGDNSQILMGLGLPGGMRNVENQIMIIRSMSLTESTIKDLPFEVEYYFRTLKNKLPIYPEVPIRVIPNNDIPLPNDTEFSLTFLGNNTFSIESKRYPLKKTAAFGESIELGRGSFVVECVDVDWLTRNMEKQLYFIAHSNRTLVRYFINRMNVELISREGSVLRISMLGTNREKDADFLNKQLENFQAISLNKKNSEANRRIQFIDDQLVGISDSLSITENRLQQFRSSHRVMDLSAQGQSIIGQVTLLENERARLSLEANYYDYLADYLNKDASGEVPIVPITMGITDPGLTRIVEELAALQSQLSVTGAGERNPLQRNLEQKVRSSKSALRETLNGLRRANSLARSDKEEQIRKVNAQASVLPVTERQLLGIERKFQLNNELYTFLLEIRAEQEMQKASNRADSELIDSADARFSTIVSPDKTKLTLVALFLGFAIPIGFIFLNLLLSTKLKEEDIRKLSDIPVVGNIPHNTDKNSTVVLENPTSAISEAFRVLRSRMQFFTKDAKSPVILVTSSMPADGKTFTSINLAAVYSLLGRNTVLVGFDLRKPRIFQDFNLGNDKGVSTWLIGRDSLKDIIQQTKYENLSIIAAGPVPPNPSELTALGKTEELFKLLKEKFDCIIIDSSPVGVVSDTMHLAICADAFLLVVRPGKTPKDIFINTLRDVRDGGAKGISLIINDIPAGSKHYGYGEKYGYTSEKERTKRGFFKRASRTKK